MGEMKFETDDERDIWIDCYRQLLRSGVDPAPADAADEVLRQLRGREREPDKAAEAAGLLEQLADCGLPEHLARAVDEALQEVTGPLGEAWQGSCLAEMETHSGIVLSALKEALFTRADVVAGVAALERGNPDRRVTGIDPAVGPDRTVFCGFKVEEDAIAEATEAARDWAGLSNEERGGFLGWLTGSAGIEPKRDLLEWAAAALAAVPALAQGQHGQRQKLEWTSEGKVNRGPGYTLIVERHLAESDDELEARSAQFIELLDVSLATLHDLQDREVAALAQIEALRLDVQQGNAEILKLDEVLGEDRQPEAGLVPSTIEAAIMLIERLRGQAVGVRRVLEEIVPDPGKDYDLMNLAHASAAIAESRRAELAAREQTDA